MELSVVGVRGVGWYSFREGIAWNEDLMCSSRCSGNLHDLWDGGPCALGGASAIFLRKNFGGGAG